MLFFLLQILYFSNFLLCYYTANRLIYKAEKK